MTSPPARFWPTLCCVGGCAQFTWGAAAVLTVVFCIIWPVMTIPAGVFSLGYFYFFVILSLAWGLVRTPFSLPVFVHWTNHPCQCHPWAFALIANTKLCLPVPISLLLASWPVLPRVAQRASVVCSACSYPSGCCLHALYPGLAVPAARPTGGAGRSRAGGGWP